jgi:hypothetical protein
MLWRRLYTGGRHDLCELELDPLARQRSGPHGGTRPRSSQGGAAERGRSYAARTAARDLTANGMASSRRGARGAQGRRRSPRPLPIRRTEVAG